MTTSLVIYRASSGSDMQAVFWKQLEHYRAGCSWPAPSSLLKLAESVRMQMLPLMWQTNQANLRDVLEAQA